MDNFTSDICFFEIYGTIFYLNVEQFSHFLLALFKRVHELSTSLTICLNQLCLCLIEMILYQYRNVNFVALCALLNILQICYGIRPIEISQQIDILIEITLKKKTTEILEK